MVVDVTKVTEMEAPASQREEEDMEVSGGEQNVLADIEVIKQQLDVFRSNLGDPSISSKPPVDEVKVQLRVSIT